MTIKEALKWGTGLLRENEVEGDKASAVFLLRQVLGVDRAHLIAHDDQKLTKIQELKYRRYIKKRSKHEPVWYITGKIEFMGLDLAVNTSVLIPRPETELMIEKIIQKLESSQIHSKFGARNSKLKVLDVGTGSGTIVLSLAKEIANNELQRFNSFIPLKKGMKKEDGSLDKRAGMTTDSDYQFFASDISPDALKVAKKNAAANDLTDRIEFREGDLFSSWKSEKFDLIVANLPYVPHEDMATLAFDLTHYEPRVALDGGVLGLEIYKKFIEQLPNFLNPGALIYLEIGYDQGRYIKDFVKKYLPKAKVTAEGDYQQIDRIVVIEA